MDSITSDISVEDLEKILTYHQNMVFSPLELQAKKMDIEYVESLISSVFCSPKSEPYPSITCETYNHPIPVSQQNPMTTNCVYPCQPITGVDNSTSQSLYLINQDLHQLFLSQKESSTKISKTFLSGQEYINLAPYFNMPISKVAEKFGAAQSTICKRISDTRRHWPYRQLRKIDKHLMTLFQNHKKSFGEEKSIIEQKIRSLLEERKNVDIPMFIPNDFHKFKK